MPKPDEGAGVKIDDPFYSECHLDHVRTRCIRPTAKSQYLAPHLFSRRLLLEGAGSGGIVHGGGCRNPADPGCCDEALAR